MHCFAPCGFLRGEIRGTRSPKNVFRPLVWSKNKGWGALPWIHYCTGIRQTKKITISNEVSSLFGFSQCVSYSPTRRFCTTWMTNCKGPICGPFTFERKRMVRFQYGLNEIGCSDELSTLYTDLRTFIFHCDRLLHASIRVKRANI